MNGGGEQPKYREMYNYAKTTDPPQNYYRETAAALVFFFLEDINLNDFMLRDKDTVGNQQGRNGFQSPCQNSEMQLTLRLIEKACPIGYIHTCPRCVVRAES